MKKFWKMVLATIIGVLILEIAGTMFFFALVGGLSAGMSANETVKVPEKAVLDLDMSRLVLAEQTVKDDFSTMFSSGYNSVQTQSLGILDASLAIEKAASDPSIACLYIRPDAAAGFSEVEEIRQAILKFRSSGKPVIAYVQTPTNCGFYLAGVADRIYMQNYIGGYNGLIGISGNLMFLKDLLDRLGVNVQLIRHGKYKSAGEMFIKNSASEENLEQNRAMIASIWKEASEKISARANMTPEKFNSLLDNLSLSVPEDFLANGLVDELVTIDEMKGKLCSAVGEDEYDDVKSISLYDYSSVEKKGRKRSDDRIAVVYADGEIGESPDPENICGRDFALMLSDIADDDDIRAVVLRVNSPGGSVKASAQIQQALAELQKKKAVVASYGSYAASGGYWISAGADYIFSDATTLTGSIGVFSMIPDFSKTAKNLLHVNSVPVPSNRHSDMYSLMRPLDSEELAYCQKDVEKIYDAFTDIVSKGRKMSKEKVDLLGQGRVWSGSDALERGLVDKIGTLHDAIEYASSIAGCPAYEIEEYPEQLSPFETMFYMFENQGEDNELVRFAKSAGKLKEAKIYARLPFDMEIR